MSDLLSIGASGLRVSRAALDVVGGNVVNAGTEGYTRRRVEAQAAPDPSSGYIQYTTRASGTGAIVGGVIRSQDQFLAAELRNSMAAAAEAGGTRKWLSEIESSLGTQSTGIASALRSFYESAEDLAAAPTSGSARAVFLERMETLAARFRDTGSSLSNLESDIHMDIDSTLFDANAAIAELDNINKKLLKAKDGTAALASLRDQRDVALTRLAEVVPVHIQETGLNQFIVKLGGPTGETIVGPGEVHTFGAEYDENGGARLLFDAGFAPRAITAPTSGAYAGLTTALGTLKTTQDAVDELANNFAATLNEQNQNGVDLAGRPGEVLLATNGVDVTESTQNMGRAAVAATIDPSANPEGTYELVYNDATSSWTMTNVETGASVSGSGTLTMDGITADLGGEPRTGDRFVLTPTTGAQNMRLINKDASRIATAAPYQIEKNNRFDGAATMTIIEDPTTSLTGTAPHTYSWTAPDAVTITDADGLVVATVPFAEGDSLPGPGFQIQVDGSPPAGASVVVGATPPNIADNSNLLAMISAGGVDGAGFEGSFAGLRTTVSASLSEARTRATIAEMSTDSARSALADATGVNLDEEAADLVRYQQSYEAAARIIAAAQDIFDALLNVR
ncbi:flagellar hook-associated protein FlgK [Pacificimonas flava]|uniref:Flagellar hook-associated protein 1 n=1 Tax=Pacificimonas flava TaxID=1234595 RepID=M2TC02_9SPHN|nr:flagellar hook-associated protein FlgK [Pacificimonas flava]EMD84159.1 Flagellar hook-associated protein FlgK [Pacificimonas flava]MBB5279963.1 flagellar hook-associated protein 1 FlgK [Pacificimonas flava]